MFLSEAELPYFARLNYQETDEVKMEETSEAGASAAASSSGTYKYKPIFFMI